MERRKALAIAATVTATLTAAATAMAANFGLLGTTTPKSPVGKLDAESVSSLVDPAASTTSTTQPIQIVYQDIPVPAAATPSASEGPAAGGDDATPAAVATTPARDAVAPAASYDDHGDDHSSAENQATTGPDDHGGSETEHDDD